MKKITNAIIAAIGYLIVALDNLLYNTLGVISPLRRSKWQKDARKIQQRLDYEHARTAWYNRVNGTNWTTKAVMSKIKD